MVVDLTGKVAIVTGAAQGIGAATATCLAASGVSVLVADIQSRKGEEVAAAITLAGGQASFVHTDVSDEAQIKRMVDGAMARYGRVDILVSNAHFEVGGSATELTAADWDQSYAVLVRALFLAAKYAIPHLQEAGGGSIINIGSVLGRYPTERYLTYTSAKAAVVQLSRQLALDYGPDGIRVNTVTPGDIWTDDRLHGDLDEQASSASSTPLRRTGTSEDIAKAICFLVSNHASFITGAELVVDGGITIPFVGAVRGRLERTRKDV